MRGIGPYYDTARLELKPITVICGKNGSGKSTWFKALDLVRRSASLADFPFAWDVSGGIQVSNIDTINARLYLHDFLGNAGDVVNGLPPGTIELQFLSVEDVHCALPFLHRADGHAVQSVLWSGIIPRDTRITVRFTHPQIWSEDEPTWFHDEIRLTVNGHHHLWFHRPLGQHGEYRFECSGSFSRGGSVDDHTLSPVSSLDPRMISTVSADPDWNTAACRNAVELIRLVTIAATRGVFHLGAIRPIQQVQYTASSGHTLGDSVEQYRQRLKKEHVARETRNVGEDGGCSLSLFRDFAYNRMIRAITPNDLGSSLATSKLETNDPVGYVFEGFVSQWLHKLLAVRISQATEARGAKSQIVDTIHEAAGPEPLGHLASGEEPVAAVLSESGEVDRDVSSEPGAFAVFEHRCFGGEAQPPGRFSAGFHQLFPIIVQVGLMQRHESFFLENPEVHLHPSLQIDLTEFLMKQAGEWQGRIILIETQSDLVIRRVLRAMIEEDARFPQRVAQIYFCALERLDDKYDQARIAPLALDEQGRVKNWPEGFLDTSPNESGRLMRAMYGDPPMDKGDE